MLNLCLTVYFEARIGDVGGFTIISYASALLISVQVNIENTDIYIEHGGLDGRYQAAQFHFHWGHDDAHGSEHTLQNTAYPLEVSLAIEPAII